MKKTNFSMKFLSLLLCFFVGRTSRCCRPEEKKDKKKAQTETVVADSTKQKSKGIPALKDFLKPNAKKYFGMMNIYEQGDRYYMEVPDNLLERDFWSSSPSSAAPPKRKEVPGTCTVSVAMPSTTRLSVSLKDRKTKSFYRNQSSVRYYRTPPPKCTGPSRRPT